LPPTYASERRCQCGEKFFWFERSGIAEHSLLDHREGGARHRFGYVDRLGGGRFSPVVGLRPGALREGWNERQQILVAEGGRHRAPLPFPVRTLGEEQAVLIDRRGHSAGGELVAREKFRPGDENLFDQLGISEKNRFGDQQPQSRQGREALAIGRGGPIHEKIVHPGA